MARPARRSMWRWLERNSAKQEWMLLTGAPPTPRTILRHLVTSRNRLGTRVVTLRSHSVQQIVFFRTGISVRWPAVAGQAQFTPSPRGKPAQACPRTVLAIFPTLHWLQLPGTMHWFIATVLVALPVRLVPRIRLWVYPLLVAHPHQLRRWQGFSLCWNRRTAHSRGRLTTLCTSWRRI